MALYAFDGTWNYDKEGTENDTNVIRFKESYAGDVEYVAGIGAKYDKHGFVTKANESKLSKIVGGLTGAGGHQRVKEMLERFAKRRKAGDNAVHGRQRAFHACTAQRSVESLVDEI